MTMYRFTYTLPLVFLLAVALAGCSDQNGTGGDKGGESKPHASALSDTGKKPQVDKDDHGHKPGQFGGIIVEIGRDNYHAEAVFEKGGVVRLYTLGKDEARIIEVEAKPLSAYVKLEGGTEATEIKFVADPRDDDTKGKTSRFTAALPKELWGKRVEVTIPTVWINGERFRVGFKSAGESHGQTSMPPPVVGEKEKQIFLAPGGKYTQADIEANKGLVPSQKFKNFIAEHDDNPQPGDWVCPVTHTKANTECAWVVDGQTYYFCCPPCVTDFVKLAKTNPEKVKKSADYLKPKEGK